MNEFEAILELIKKDYPVRRMGEHYAQIELDELFDPYNYIFIGVLYEDDVVILTDMAEYAEVCEWEEEDLPEVEKICKKHDITFHNWHIECFYHTNEDIKKYLECLLELSEKYATK